MMLKDLSKAPVADRFEHLLNTISSDRFLQKKGLGKETVSYTHLTLPTRLSV